MNSREKWLIKKTIFLSVIIIVSFSFSSRITANPKLLELNNDISESEGKDRVNTLNDLAYKEFSFSPSICIKYAKEALALAQKYKYPRGEAKALNNIGLAYWIKAQYYKALKYHQKSKKISEEIGDKQGIASSLGNIGNVYQHQGDYEKALNYHLKSWKISAEIEDKLGIARSSGNIGILYRKLKDYHKALEFHQKSLQLKKELGKTLEAGISLNNIGLVYHDLKAYDKALDYFQQSLNQIKVYNNKRLISSILNNIGLVYKDLGNLNQSLNFCFRSLEIKKEIGNKKGMVHSLGLIGSVYTIFNQYDLAFSYLNQGLKIAKEINVKGLMIDIYKALYDLGKARGNFKNALRFAVLFYKAEQELLNEKTNKQINQLKVEFETDKKELENQALKKENRIQRLENRVTIIAAIFILIIIMAIIYQFFRYYRNFKTELKQNEEKLNTLQMESQLKLFQARINPHFLFNSLDSLIGIGYEKDPKKLKRIIKKLSNLYRNILSSTGIPQIPVKTELEIIKDYLDIENRILQGRLDYKISVEENVLNCLILPLIIVNLVENAVTHGILKKEGGGTIDINIYHQDGLLKINVTDSGVGFDSTKVHQGFGLYSIQERLKLFYKGKARLNMVNLQKGGTQAIIEVPYG